MKPQLKVPIHLTEAILDDLERPHPYAYERVGFLLCRHTEDPDGLTLFAYEYHSIPDDMYIHDEDCGARINGDAIRMAMGLAFKQKCSLLHVHTHGNLQPIYPSETDRTELPGLAKSFANAGGSKPHGWIILSESNAYGEIYHAGQIHVFTDYYGIGIPLKIPGHRHDKYLRGDGDADDPSRQSFLGENSEALISTAKIGIIGLGGGGSHIAQQLAHLGFLDFVLCDKDYISRSNLNRLVGGSDNDVKMKRQKTAIAESLILSIQPEARIDSEPLTWEEKVRQLQECDIIFGCIDSFLGRKQLEDFCRRYFIPYVDIGMVVNKQSAEVHEIYGQVSLSLPGKPCMQCTKVLADELIAKEVEEYGDAGPQPQVVWPNGVLASNAVGIAVELLTGWSGRDTLPSRLDYEGSTLSVSESPICKHLDRCSHHPLSECGEPIFWEC